MFYQSTNLKSTKYPQIKLDNSDDFRKVNA